MTDIIEQKKTVKSIIKQRGVSDSLYLVEEAEGIEIGIKRFTPGELNKVINYSKEYLGDIDKYHIQQEVNIGQEITNIAVFENIIFNKEVNQNGINFNKKIEIRNCTFKEKVFFKYCTFFKDIVFEHNNFNAGVIFEIVFFESNIDFNNIYFSSNSKLNYLVFKKEAKIEKCKFHINQINNITFENYVSFSGCEFFKSITLSHQTFKSVVNFGKTKFHKQLKIKHSEITSDTVINFENAQFQSGLDISQANLLCELNFWGAQVNHMPREIDYYCEEDGDIKLNPYNCLRESYRIIKHSLEKVGNRIEALKFKTYEMDMYRKELEEDERELTAEGVIMWANYISNNFGMDWWRGVLFTLWSTYVTYIMMLFFLSPNIPFDLYADFTTEPLRHFLEILNITNWNIEIYGHKDYNLAYIPLFIGRIFIGFGYYQTIQAFRKYGK